MSLRSRVVLAVAVVFAIVSFITGWLMLNRVENRLRLAFDRAMKTRAGWLLSLVSMEPVVIPLPANTEQMRVVYETYGQQRELFRSPAFPRETHRPDSSGGLVNYLAVTVEATRNQWPDGRLSLTLAVSDESLRQDISQLRWLFSLGWLVSLLLAFGGGYVVAGWLLKPIQVIVRQADTISNAVSIEPIKLPAANDELYQLTNALNQMLTRIRASTELQRNFFGAAAHELRTPLTVMKTGLEVTMNSGWINDDLRPFLSGQLDEMSRLTRLLDEFLTLSRPENSSLPINRQRVEISELVAACLNQLTHRVLDYGVTIQSAVSVEPGSTLITDKTKLEQIVMNLLENAIKYAVPATAVGIDISGADVWRIRVQNRTRRETGPILNLLQPYFQADPFSEGHGLGLWISHQFTTLLGGQLHLDWKTFVFTAELVLPKNQV